VAVAAVVIVVHRAVLVVPLEAVQVVVVPQGETAEEARVGKSDFHG
jgi:hypothetical protein